MAQPRLGRGFAALVSTQLAVDALQMALEGVNGDEHSPGDLLVGLPVRQQTQSLLTWVSIPV